MALRLSELLADNKLFLSPVIQPQFLAWLSQRTGAEEDFQTEFRTLLL